MGISILKIPRGLNETPGPLTPPVEFDRTKFASKWVKEGPGVEAAGQREYLVGTKYTADGWQVWKFPEGSKDAGKPYKIPLSGGNYVLLYRDLTVQQAVNAIYGNVGKERLSQERQHPTVVDASDGRLNPNDPGILSDAVIKARAEREAWDGTGDVMMNPVPGLENTGKVSRPKLRTQRR